MIVNCVNKECVLLPRASYELLCTTKFTKNSKNMMNKFCEYGLRCLQLSATNAILKLDGSFFHCPCVRQIKAG